jgi:hypothetical protein
VASDHVTDGLVIYIQRVRREKREKRERKGHIGTSCKASGSASPSGFPLYRAVNMPISYVGQFSQFYVIERERKERCSIISGEGSKLGKVPWTTGICRSGREPGNKSRE